MSAWRIDLPPHVAQVIRHLPPEVKRGVKAALRAVAADPATGGQLRGDLEGLWKFRVRRYRIVYAVDRRERVIRVFASRLRHLTVLVEDLSFRHVTSRLAKVLLMQAEEAGKGRSLHLTQQDLASMVGTAREVVVRSLRSLESQGILKRERHRLVVLDKEALWRLA